MKLRPPQTAALALALLGAGALPSLATAANAGCTPEVAKLLRTLQKSRTRFLERITSSSDEINRATEAAEAEATWARTIKDDGPGEFLYRGMFLDPKSDALKTIATRGLLPERTYYGATYLAKDPSVAIPYMQGTFAPRPGWQPSVRVVIKVDPKKLGRLGAARGALSTRKPIPPEAIEKIYIFDKEGKREFPFLALTPSELARLLK